MEANLNQPPGNAETGDRTAAWRRPRGVASGTWDYVNERSIADRYDAFVADAPLCIVDQDILATLFPTLSSVAGQETDLHSPCLPPMVLDLGCGTGRTAIPLARRGYRVIGVDLSQSMLEQLRSKRDLEARASVLDAETRGRLSMVRANLVELSGFRDAVADHAVCMFSTFGMIQGREHRREMLRHVARIVRPGGRFVVHVHNRWAAVREPGGLRQLVRSWLVSRGGGLEFGDAIYAYRGLVKMFMHRFSKRELESDLRHSGWRVTAGIGLSLDGALRRGLRWPLQLNCGGFLMIAENGGP